MAVLECRSDDERRARDVLRSVLGCAVDCVDPGGGPAAVADLLATKPDGRLLAVEVTSLVDPGNRSLHSELAKRDWSDERLSWWWSVHCQGRIDPRVAHREFAEHFAALEQAGVETFDRYRMRRHALIDGQFVEVPPWRVNHANLEDSPIRHEIEPVFDKLFALGITAGVRLAAESPGAINLQPRQQGGAFAASSAADALAEAINQPDNLAKLRGADAHGRHLFLWVHFDGGAASAALQMAASDGIVPDAPELPDGVDAAWVAGAWTNPNKPEQLTSVLFYVDGNGWKHIGAVEGPPTTQDEYGDGTHPTATESE